MSADADVTLIDGGLSTALESLGVDVSGPLWTARAIRDEPARLEDAHRAFVAAGARIVTTASYQCAADDEEGLRSATAIARRAASGRRVAASVGPYGASRADGSEYHGRYGVDLSVVAEHHRRKLATLVSSRPDLLAVETQPRADEARIIAGLLEELGAPPAWFSFTFEDDPGLVDRVTTRGGDSVDAVLEAVAGYPNLLAVGVNCTAPATVTAILSRFRDLAPRVALIAYPNHGGQWQPAERTWTRTADSVFTDGCLEEWIGLGANFVGGCCGIGPADIADLARRLGIATDQSDVG